MTNIRPDHAEHLAGFRITPEILTAARVQSLTDSETRELLGVNGKYDGHNLSGIAFPSFDPITDRRTGARVRLDMPLDNDTKYLMEIGNRHLFFAPGALQFLNDTSVAVIFVEAEKSGIGARLPCVHVGATSSSRLAAVTVGNANAEKSINRTAVMNGKPGPRSSST